MLAQTIGISQLFDLLLGALVQLFVAFEKS